jgi:hypothetical protein
MTDAWSNERTNDPVYADDRNFYKVEAWGRDGIHIIALLYAGKSRQGAGDFCYDRQASAAD